MIRRSSKLINWIKSFFNKKDVTFQGKIEINIQNVDDGLWKKYEHSIKVFGENVKICKEFSSKKIRQYIYNPIDKPIDANQFTEVVFQLLSLDLDYLIVSNTLDNYPIIGTKNMEDAIVFARRFGSVNGLKENNKPKCGKLLRLSGYSKDDSVANLQDEFSDIRLENESYLVSNGGIIPAYRKIGSIAPYQKRKKMVFVLPIFMAVGGVERNTIEIMRCLQEEYEFCVITMERHSKEQGSLNYQLDGLCVANYDLRELVEFNNYFDALSTLKEMYQPDILWLCNNSPWLEANLLKFRELFSKQKIVAQDVYDTKYGWIEYYASEGIHSLDKFIAINKKIEQAFIEEYKIEESRIDVIYPAVDDKKIRNEIAVPVNREAICKKYGLDSNKKHFTYVGRLTNQKNPLRYASLAKKILEENEDMEWLIVGDGELAEQVDVYISANHLEGKLIRLPYVANVPELYKVIDGLVIFSFYEGMPIVSIEAMSMGVPIFGTDVGDLRLFVEKINCGRIIPIENEDDYTEFMNWYHSYETYKKNAVDSAAEILDFFSASTLAELYKKSFEK